MSETKPSPGDWEVVWVHGNALGVGVASHGKYGTTYRMICNSLAKKNKPSAIAEAEANTRILAASKDMLAMLQGHASLECWCDPDLSKGLDPCLRCQTVALIASITEVEGG